MLSLNSETKIFVALGATDMRMGFDGLCGLVAHQLNQDSLSGSLVPFR
jgi:transposase